MVVRTANHTPSDYQSHRMIWLWRKGYGYLHMSGQGYVGTADYAWRGFRYQARNLLAGMDPEEAAEIEIRENDE